MRWGFSIIIAACLLASLSLAHTRGKASRVFGKPMPLSEAALSAYVLERPAEMYTRWKDAGIRGRVAVVFSDRMFLEFSAGNPKYRRDDFPPYEPLRDWQEQNLNDRNPVSIGLRNNMLREVWYVMPPEKFMAQKTAITGKTRNPAIISVSEDTIRLGLRGTPVTITTSIPRITEAVIVDIDSSFLFGERPDWGIDDLRASGLMTDLMTVSISNQAEGFTAQSARELLSMLSGEKR